MLGSRGVCGRAHESQYGPQMTLRDSASVRIGRLRKSRTTCGRHSRNGMSPSSSPSANPRKPRSGAPFPRTSQSDGVDSCRSRVRIAAGMSTEGEFFRLALIYSHQNDDGVRPPEVARRSGWGGRVTRCVNALFRCTPFTRGEWRWPDTQSDGGASADARTAHHPAGSRPDPTSSATARCSRRR